MTVQARRQESAEERVTPLELFFDQRPGRARRPVVGLDGVGLADEHHQPLALLPLAVELPALATLALVAALCVGLIVYEAIRFGEARYSVRHATEPATASGAS